MSNATQFPRKQTLDKQILLELFLETDAITTLNRVAIAGSGVAQENVDIISKFRAAVKRHKNVKKGTTKRKKTTVLKNKKTDYKFKNIEKYTDEEYEKKFQMKRLTLKNLHACLLPLVREKDSLYKKLHIFLWLLTNGSTCMEVGLIFGMYRKTVSRIIDEVSSLVVKLKDDIITMPSTVQQQMTIMKVNADYGFPNCIGFIDAFMIEIKIKNKRVPLQCVCDETMKIMDVHVGEIGDCKANVYKSSSLSKTLKHNVSFENHILGDVSYKLKKNLMTPFSEVKLLSTEERRYNKVHETARSIITSTFQRLNRNFKFLDTIEVISDRTIYNVITSACVLHNFILINECNIDPIKCEIIEPFHIGKSTVRNAIEKRNVLCNYINS